MASLEIPQQPQDLNPSYPQEPPSQNEVHPALRNWSLPEEVPLKRLIRLAGENPNSQNMGGGLPSPILIKKFHQLARQAWAQTEEIKIGEMIDIYQYPLAGGALEHRRAILDHFLGNRERTMIYENFSENDPRQGLFLTYGSQEAIFLMGKKLVDLEKATPEHPVELAITSPVYPGLLMALEDFITKKLIKFRIVRVDDNGNINLNDLKTALSNERCKGLYLAEGNPFPKNFSNLSEVAQELSEPQYEDKLIFEDRAYKDLGGSEKSLVTMMDQNRIVVACETWSKKGAPVRLGIVYSNQTPEKFLPISQNMLKDQYNHSLGYSGEISGLAYAILNNPSMREKYNQHLTEVLEFYEKRRKLYVSHYKSALDLAYGQNNYNLADKITVGEKYFMFGWRKIPVPSDVYVQAGSMIGVYSVAGLGCKPNPEDVVDEYYGETDVTPYRLRQNYTYAPESALEIGIYKDVLLEILFSDLDPQFKHQAYHRLLEKISQLGDDKIEAIEELWRQME